MIVGYTERGLMVWILCGQRQYCFGSICWVL